MSLPVAQLETLRALNRGEPILITASAEGLIQPVPAPEDFRQQSFELEAGKQYPFETLVKRLDALGFERTDFVSTYGEFAVRGGIVDVYPFVGENPIRLEFWGDTVESIREFDPQSQRSIRTLQAATIVANRSSHSDQPQSSFTLLSYLPADALLVLDEPALMEREITSLVDNGLVQADVWKSARAKIDSFARIIHSSFHDTGAQALIDVGAIPQPSFNGTVKLLVQEIRSLRTRGIEACLLSDTREEAERLRELIEEEVVSGDGFADATLTAASEGDTDVRYVGETIHGGFILPDAGLALLTEHQVFGRIRRQGLRKRPRGRGFTQRELARLKRGDFVVHTDYGIGRFAGLERIRVRGVEHEVMKIVYAEGDTLYVNLNTINRVQKYASNEGHVPALTRLGTPQWERIKAKAKKRVKDIARSLIQLYARRKSEQGFAFPPDTHWQKELEASFMYEDTPDQERATVDVKTDMEQPAPMDRLICGDVGFGKTEVAVRAAFKAVMGGKQVAVLVPTTILAQQHYHTFLDRLGKYALRVETLTRFRSRREQAAVLTALSEGNVDILIGTHRLLSKDVAFKDLGLLVVDEEHRFGVTAKERLRELRASVDTLALTATPIPRTLQFSLMGARDLSLITTPPRNRRPIETELAPFDLRLIREAILREVRRGGQVYFIHDRVRTIEQIQQTLEEHIPEARFHVAHGQMKGHELEKTMLDFLERKYDVLICTKIIESGIDIPSVNTIIINRADRFGLAELYQLRGRVGRSNEQAYAYLLTPPPSVLPRETLRRLQAIQEFTELGSGFNLAMRDLEIRGAGNLLGAEQSGFIMEMGIEMYQNIVEEAVAELKEQEFKTAIATSIEESMNPPKVNGRADTVVETDVEALIPEFYVESDAERFDIYRRLYATTDAQAIAQLRDELRDRFGEYPEEVEHLLLSVELKMYAAKVGAEKVELHGNALRLTLPKPEATWFYESSNGRPPAFQALVDQFPAMSPLAPRLKQEGKALILVMTLPAADNPLHRLLRALEAARGLGEIHTQPISELLGP
jgi:transcription-repair coupling factor (superfamily II helicase)